MNARWPITHAYGPETAYRPRCREPEPDGSPNLTDEGILCDRCLEAEMQHVSETLRGQLVGSLALVFVHRIVEFANAYPALIREGMKPLIDDARAVIAAEGSQHG